MLGIPDIMDDHAKDRLTTEHLSSRSDVCRDDAGSSLLSFTSHARTSSEPTEDRLGSVHNDAGPRKGGGVQYVAPSESSESSTAVYWHGLPHYLLTWELLNIVLSLCFLALGACLASLEGTSASPWSRRVVQASRIAPSVWPIVFSGILGNAIRAYADYRVERGISLLGLEQLLGSGTMASSIITIFRWSIFRASSIVILFLWAFNPLGSQASFRGVDMRPDFGMHSGNITYYSPDIVVQLFLSPFIGESSLVMRAFYSTTLYDYVARTQYVDTTHGEAKRVVTMMGGEATVATQAAMDTWGNVRIPALEYLDGYDPEHPHRWVEAPWNQKVLNYSSLLGDRVNGIDRSIVGNTTFTIESSYQHHNCISWFQLNATAPFANATRSSNSSSEADTWFRKNTGKTYTQQASRSTEVDRTFIVTHVLSSMTANMGIPELIFASAFANGTKLSVTKCTASTMYVEAEVICASKSDSIRADCGVYAIRETSDPPRDPSLSILDQRDGAQFSFTSFMDTLDVIRTGGDYSSNTENYLLDPLFAFTNPDGRDPNKMLADSQRSSGGRNADSNVNLTRPALHSVDIRLFERRFSLLWNTLWQIAWSRKSIAGGDLDKGNIIASARDIETVRNTTSRVKVPLPPVYTINRTWMQLYFVSADVMLLAAIFALIMRWQCRAPAILGYASSLLRDSVYFEDCGIYRNSVEDGPEKTRRLGKMMVMVADVRSGDPVAGKIAFAPRRTSIRVRTRRSYY